MSERLLEIARAADGRFLAVHDPRLPAVVVTSWDDVRRLRGRSHLVDHWSAQDLAAFIAEHGHPFDDWWASLSAESRAALKADPHGPVPGVHHDEVKRTLARQSKQAGLGLQGSALTPELAAYVASTPTS
jgi:hypothetical protein